MPVGEERLVRPNTRRSLLKRSAIFAGIVGIVPPGIIGLRGQTDVGGMGMTHAFNMLRFQQRGITVLHLKLGCITLLA